MFKHKGKNRTDRHNTGIASLLYRLDKQYSPISAIASLYYLFDTIGIYSRKHSG
jgi:hypothetical protein